MIGLTRPRRLALVALAGASAALTAGSITSAATQAKTTAKADKPKIICRARLVGVLPPGTSVENYGTVSCTGSAFGDGVQHDTATLSRPSETEAALKGRLRLFFDTGTLRGTYKASVTVTDATATYKGTIKISSGTGTYRGATGTGTIAGTSHDAGHATLTERLNLAIPAAD